MIRLVFLIGLIAAAFGVRHWLRIAPPAQVRRILSKTALWSGIGLLVLAVLTGHFNALFAAVAAVGLLLARIERVLDVIPQFRQLFQAFTQQTPAPPAPHDGHFSDAEARAILGVAADADADTIRAAHRRLMQRLHPDRGGSDCLAAQINAAKQRLLGD